MPLDSRVLSGKDFQTSPLCASFSSSASLRVPLISPSWPLRSLRRVFLLPCPSPEAAVRLSSLDWFPKHQSSAAPGSLLGVPGPTLAPRSPEPLSPSWLGTHSASRSRQTPGGGGGSGVLERRQGPGARHPAGWGPPPCSGAAAPLGAPRLAEERVSFTVQSHPPPVPIHFMAARGAPSPPRRAVSPRPRPFPAAPPWPLPFQL